jgi:ubiquinone/menaquinone biosynthesis C-methylase UbiE
MNELKIITDFYSDLEKLGPGDIEQSKKALSYIKFTTSSPQIVDIGCGTGSQTIFLAKETNSQIIAVDFLQPFLDELEKKAKSYNVDIKTVCASMDKLPFSEESFDLIWSEGAIYNMGFNNGIKYIHKYLKPNGYLAITEISWLTEDRPNEIEDHWEKEYSEIDNIENKLKQLENNGYKILSHFTLPNNCWESYYEPIKNKIKAFLQKWGNSKEAIDFVNGEIKEIELYEKYNQYYGYVFYIAQKSEQ